MKQEHRMEISKKPRIGKKCIIFIRNTAHISKGKPCRRHWEITHIFSCFSASKRKETRDAFGPVSNLSKNTM
jgi:hypothetical protein